MFLESRIEHFITAHQMLDAGDHVLVAVSGGPDSVSLLSILHGLCGTWNLTLHVVHFDHGIRGLESDADAVFTTNLCQQFAIPCTVKRLQLDSGSRRPHGYSLQEYARHLRYQEMACLASEVGAHKIAVGHTADDQTETLMMWMVRGTGTRGLCGIPPVRDPQVIRPLLHTSRAELLAYLKDQGMTYRMDSSNDKPIYLRNRIRNEVMPLLKQYNPNVIRAVARQADIVREEDTFLEQLAYEALAQVRLHSIGHRLMLHRMHFLQLSLAMKRRVLRIVLQEVSEMETMPSFDAIERLLKHIDSGQSGSWVEVYGVSIIREYEQIHICMSEARLVASPKVQPMVVPSQVVWPLTGQIMAVSTATSSSQAMLTEKNPYQVRFDADACTSSFVLRNWKMGDHFHPLGMGGKRKKLQDFFSDIKLARFYRHTVPLLVAPEGIVWVGGYRLDHRFRVTDSTKNVLVANLSEVPRPV